MSRFSNCEGRGFHLTFDNGWTISVQFTGGHYCDNKNERYDIAKTRIERDLPMHSSNAEIAVWSNSGPHNGALVELEHDCVRGYTTANEVAKVITIISRAKSTISNEQMSNKLRRVWKCWKNV